MGCNHLPYRRPRSAAAMARVLVTRQLPPGGLDPLEGHELVQREGDHPLTHQELVEAVAGVEGIVCLLTDRIDAEVIAAGRNLKAVGNVAVGYDNVDVAAAERAGVAVCNTPGVLDETTADVAFGLILAASRLFGEAERDLRAGRWTRPWSRAPFSPPAWTCTRTSRTCRRSCWPLRGPCCCPTSAAARCRPERPWPGWPPAASAPSSPASAQPTWSPDSVECPRTG